MVQSNHFSSEFSRVPSDQLDGALPCVTGVHGAFDLTAEARYLHAHIARLGQKDFWLCS